MAVKNKFGETLTPRQQKANVLKYTGWTSAQYNKEYDKLRNRVRNFERINGYERGSINAADLLAREMRQRYYRPRYGEEVRSTTLYTTVMQTTSASTGSKLSEASLARGRRVGFEGLQTGYKNLLAHSPFVAKAARPQMERYSRGEATLAEVEEAIKAARDLARSLDAAADLAYRTNLRKGIIGAKPYSVFYEE